MFSSVTMQKTEGDFRENLRAKYCNDKYIRDVYDMLGWGQHVGAQGLLWLSVQRSILVGSYAWENHM